MNQIPSHEKDELGFFFHHAGNALVMLIIAFAAVAGAVALALPEWMETLVLTYKWIGFSALIVIALSSLLFVAVSIRSLVVGRDVLRREFHEFRSSPPSHHDRLPREGENTDGV